MAAGAVSPHRVACGRQAQRLPSKHVRRRPRPRHSPATTTACCQMLEEESGGVKFADIEGPPPANFQPVNETWSNPPA